MKEKYFLRPWRNAWVFFSVLMLSCTAILAPIGQAHAAGITTQPPHTNPTGVGIGLIGNKGAYSFWLGTEGSYQGWARYCIQWLMADPGNAEVVNVTDLSSSTPRLSGYELTTPQTAYLLEKYNNTQDTLTAAGISFLVHANFEVDGKVKADRAVADMEKKVNTHAPQIAAKALELRAEAIKSAAIGYSNSSVDGGGKREGTISGIYTTYDDGSPAINVPVTVKLNGPAIITESGTNTWSGVTTNAPITLHWKSTGNGKVTYNVSYAGTHKTLSLIDHNGKVQKTITRKIAGPADPEVREGEAFNVIYDFQPLGVSKAVSQEVNTDGTISDVLTTGVDKDYGSGQWLEVGGNPVEVTYKATAYWAGRVKPATADSVPAGAEKLGEVKVKASGEGQNLTAKLKTTKRGYITWVWEVIKAEQGANSDYVHANWKDKYGLDAETSRENFPFRPMGVSKAHSVEVNTDGKVRDSLTTMVDKAFRDGEWTRLGDGSFDAGDYVPVTYRATAYWAGRVKPKTVDAVPEGAVKLGEVLVTGNKPGQVLNAEVNVTKRGWVTWVWEVREADQAKEYAKWIDSGWKDKYGLDAETSRENFPFRPMGVSKAHSVEVNTDGKVRDSLTTMVDKAFRDGEWTRLGDGSFDAGDYVPVTYRATAYWAGRVKPKTSDSVPEGAVKLGEVLVTASKPGQVLNAEVNVTKRGWVTWVWEVREADQAKEYAKWIDSGWKDKYGLDAETSRENFPFRPMGVSKAHSVEVNTDGKVRDSLTTMVDKAFRDGEWTRLGDGSFDAGEYVPVTYRATAYWAGRVKPKTSDSVPEGAVKLGEVLVTASKPGQVLNAEVNVTKRGWVTWVWEVREADQAKEYAKWIDSGWKDKYGLDAETSRENFPFRPMGVSKAHSVEVNTDGKVRDSLTTMVDKAFRDGEWTRLGDGSFDAGEYVPVTYRATAYWAGRVKPKTSDSVPEGAVKLGEVLVTASKPGQVLNAEVNVTKRGWVTWVWEVREADQAKEYAKWIDSGWKDKYGLDAETSRENFPFRPMGVSKAHSVEVNTDGKVRDSLTTMVDKAFRDGEWTRLGDGSFDAGEYVPVTYRATAYWAGRVKPKTVDAVPEGAVKLGEVLVTGNKPGQVLNAEVNVTKRGWVTWVWEVREADQAKEYAKWIDSGWKDKYGLDAETSRENFPFRPMGVSNVVSAKVVDGQDLTDTFTASADPRFRDGEWTRLGDGSFDAGEYVPVTYRASVYFHSPSMLPEESKAAPDKAELIKSMTVTASKPGQVLKVNAGGAPKDGFYTWVWEVREADQAKEYVKWIDSGWIDGYGIPEETTSARYEAVIDSALSVRDTKSGTYFVDDVWVKGMPVNHPDFAGGAGFKADVKVIEHSILFFPHGVEVVEENISQAVKIGNTVSIPAKNGFYPSIGDTSWLAKIDKAGKLVPGTYVFVSSFAGDDRVKSLTTSVEDKAEQFTVKPEPSVHTTLMYDNTRGKVPGFGVRKLVDVVTYTNLEVGKPYSVDGELVDKATGKPLLNGEGKPIVSKAEFKAESVNGSVEVVFEVDAGLFAGKTTVAFETLKSDGREIAVHADINDENQTIGFEPGSKLKTTARDVADEDKEIKPEANQTIVDRVCDVNKQLKPGVAYEIVTSLVFDDGKPVLDANGKPVVVKSKFIPKSSDDCATVEISFDATGFEGRKIVVFEDVLYNGQTVSVHHDLKDEDQTVTVFKPFIPDLVKTGAAGMVVLATIAASAFITGFVMLRSRKKGTNREREEDDLFPKAI